MVLPAGKLLLWLSKMMAVGLFDSPTTRYGAWVDPNTELDSVVPSLLLVTPAKADHHGFATAKLEAGKDRLLS